ncbi:MAG: cyclase family protein [Phycisphaerae bacterium]
MSRRRAARRWSAFFLEQSPTMLYDITPPVTPELAVWPGDTPPSRRVLLDLSKGDTVTLSTLTATVHLGAHADAPSHYGCAAAAIESRRLDYYLGPCQVIHIPVPPRTRITPAMLGGEIVAPRVLIATHTAPDPNRWTPDFAALTPELVDWLHARGVVLAGIDTPSVDVSDSKDLPTHARFLANDMAILEGVVLGDVPAGTYELIALPLRLVGFDASPVRAVLRGINT